MTDRQFVEALDRIFDEALPKADSMLREDGFLATTVHAFSRHGAVCSVLQGDVDAAPQAVTGGSIPMYVLPGPLRGHVETLRQIFAGHHAVAALMLSEFWTFPADDPTAVSAYLAGTGGPPSQHPRRREGVIATLSWPLGGLLRMASRRIVRAGASAYLRPWPDEHLNSFTEGAGIAELSLLSTWLEETLPGRDPHEFRAGGA